jgi:hypothetical protein
MGRWRTRRVRRSYRRSFSCSSWRMQHPPVPAVQLPSVEEVAVRDYNLPHPTPRPGAVIFKSGSGLLNTPAAQEPERHEREEAMKGVHVSRRRRNTNQCTTLRVRAFRARRTEGGRDGDGECVLVGGQGKELGCVCWVISWQETLAPPPPRHFLSPAFPHSPPHRVCASGVHPTPASHCIVDCGRRSGALSLNTEGWAAPRRSVRDCARALFFSRCRGMTGRIDCAIISSPPFRPAAC